MMGKAYGLYRRGTITIQMLLPYVQKPEEAQDLAFLPIASATSDIRPGLRDTLIATVVPNAKCPYALRSLLGPEVR
jgi:hypothetical protein